MELAGSDDFGQFLHVGRFDVHYIKRLIRYLHMPKINPEKNSDCMIKFSVKLHCLKQYGGEIVFLVYIIIFDSSIVKINEKLVKN